MTATALHASPDDELQMLEQDQERIETALRAALDSPLVDEMLRAEHRWVMRKKRALDRHAVSCPAMLHFRGATRPCRIRDVSAHGAGVDMEAAQPRVGDEACLVLTELPGAPSLAAVVRHVTGTRVGVEFTPHGDAAKGVAEELGRRFGVRDPS